jgi:predicted RNA methylase
MTNTTWLILEILTIFIVIVPTAYAFIYGAPFVPTPMDRIKKMLELGKLKKGMKHYDLGCGDGRSPYLANKLYKSDSTGLEFTPFVYIWAQIRKIFWRSKAKILYRNFYKYNIADADVITCYLLPESMARLRKKFSKELKKGTKIISYAFAIKEWEPIYIEPRNPEKNRARILVYEIGKGTG